MGKPFDISRFRKGITKSIEGISVGFNDPKIWIPTGNYCLNYLISGEFNKGVPLGKITVFAGASGSGKSYLVSGSIVKAAQEMGIYVIMIDSENALDESWLHALGVDTSESKMLRLSMTMINDVAKMIYEFVENYKEYPVEERPKVLFVIDSLGMLLSPTQVSQFEGGEMKGDMGIKAKQLKALVQNCVNRFGDLDIGMVATNHTYESQDPYNPDAIVSGGNGFIFASSIVVAMKQLKLKEDVEGKKTTDILGIRSGCKTLKTRYNKPFETMEIQIPWEGGMLPYSGLFDLFEKHGIVKLDGKRYNYTALDGTVYLKWRKEYLTNEDGILDIIMSEFHQKKALIIPIVDVVDDIPGE